MGMPESEQKILEEVEYLRDRYFTYDEPVPFCGLMMYPVSVRNYNDFLSCSSCLTFNKNDDIVGIKMTNLEYLLHKMTNGAEGQIWSFKFSHLIELVFHIRNGLKCNKCGSYVSYDQIIQRFSACKTDSDQEKIMCCPDENCDGKLEEVVRYGTDEKTGRKFFTIDGNTITSDDFNKMRKYIMYQNLPDYKDDSWVEKSIREDQALKNEMKSRDSGTATLERKIMCLCAKSNYKINEIYDLSVRKFTFLLGVIQDAMEYEIARTGLMSGFVSLKKGESIDHWIYKKETGLYDKAVDAEQLAAQIQS